VLRTDGGGPGLIRVEVARGDGVLEARDVELPPRAEGRWHEVRASLASARGGDRIRLVAVRGAWRSFHAWIVREPTARE